MAKKRSITDEEIALIKAMTARGMKNKDIQFFFRRTPSNRRLVGPAEGVSMTWRASNRRTVG